jgi:anti-sigma regulatory factor (Ser/Thr protein kinase)
VAIVVYRRPPPSLHIEVSASANELSTVRAQLADWLRLTGVSRELTGDIVLIVNEACSNSIEHGYRGGRAGRVLIDVDAMGTEIRILVADFGSWKVPDANPWLRGRGVPLMRAVAGEVEVTGTSAGTTVAMKVELT